MSKSLWGKYIEERLGKHIYETEHGFATYYFYKDDCYIEDIFVEKEFRHEGIAKQMTEEIKKIARQYGSKRLIGSVVPSSNGSTYSLAAFLRYGFKLDSCTNNFIVLTKEVDEYIPELEREK